MEKQVRIVYNLDGALKATVVPEGMTVAGFSKYITDNGGTPIRAVMSSSAAEAKRLASASPGPTDRIETKEEQSTANKAADLAAMYGIDPEEGMSYASQSPAVTNALLTGKDVGFGESMSDILTALPRSLYGDLARSGPISKEERMGEGGIQANPSLIPTIAAAAATGGMSIPAQILTTGAAQIGTEAYLDPDYSTENLAVDAATLPLAGAGKALPIAGKAAQKVLPNVSKFIAREANKVPFLGPMLGTPIEKGTAAVTGVLKDPFTAQMLAWQSPVLRAAWEEDVRSNYIDWLNRVPAVNPPGPTQNYFLED